MDDRNRLAERFEGERPRLLALARRVTGSPADAEDAVQETWLRLQGADHDALENVSGWLTTVVGRVCLDMLRSRASRREDALEVSNAELPGRTPDPAREAELADSVGAALAVVLDTLAPAERVTLVLHDTFAMPFDEIAAIVGRRPAATRQLASRARRRVQGAGGETADTGSASREVVSAFLAASRGGDLGGLIALLDPDVVLRSDPTVVGYGAVAEVRGPEAVADMFAGRARAARAALIDGVPGAVWAQRGELRVAFEFVVRGNRVVSIDLLADPEILRGLDVAALDD